MSRPLGASRPGRARCDWCRSGRHARCVEDRRQLGPGNCQCGCGRCAACGKVRVGREGRRTAVVEDALALVCGRCRRLPEAQFEARVLARKLRGRGG